NPGYSVQNSRGVYKWSVGNVQNISGNTLRNSNYKKEDIEWFAPHSANARMIELICEEANLSKDKALMSLKYYGNTSSATIPLSIDLAVQAHQLKKGDLMLLVGFGGGLSYASTLIKWTL